MANSVVFPAVTSTRFHFIVSESNGYQSREEGVIAAGSPLMPGGTILGRITSSGKFKNFDPAASDGSQNAIAILGENVDATAGDVKRAIFVRNMEVQRAMLSFIGTPTPTQQAAAYASLGAAGIAFR